MGYKGNLLQATINGYRYIYGVMRTQSLQLTVSPSAGTVSAIHMAGENPASVFTLAHGAGAGMDHRFMESLATALAHAGIATLRFNFPFAEQQKRRPDTPAVAHLTIAAAIANARELHPGLPLFVSGKSFGGRMGSQYVAAHPDLRISGLVFYGFPLHPAGKPSTERAAHLHALDRPMLFLQGSRDTLATWELIQSVCDPLPTASLVRLEGADHSFNAGKTDTIPLLVDETAKWAAITRQKPK